MSASTYTCLNWSYHDCALNWSPLQMNLWIPSLSGQIPKSVFIFIVCFLQFSKLPMKWGCVGGVGGRSLPTHPQNCTQAPVSDQILVYNTISQWREARLFGEMADSKMEVRYIQNEPGDSSSTRSKEFLKKTNKQNLKTTMMWICQQTQSQWKNSQWPKPENQNK